MEAEQWLPEKLKYVESTTKNDLQSNGYTLEWFIAPINDRESIGKPGVKCHPFKWSYFTSNNRRGATL